MDAVPAVDDDGVNPGSEASKQEAPEQVWDVVCAGLIVWRAKS